MVGVEDLGKSLLEKWVLNDIFSNNCFTHYQDMVSFVLHILQKWHI